MVNTLKDSSVNHNSEEKQHITSNAKKANLL